MNRYEEDPNDPIAEKLRNHDDSKSEEYRKRLHQASLNAQARRKYFENHVFPTLQERNWIEGQEDPQAKYESIDMLESDDEDVLDFLRMLGLNPETLESASLIIENNQPLKINATMYAIKARRKGSQFSDWEWDPENWTWDTEKGNDNE